MATSPNEPKESYFSIVKAQVEKNGGSINLEGEEQYQNMFIEYFEVMRKLPKHNSTIKAVAYISALTKVPITYQVGVHGVTAINDIDFTNGIKVMINFEQIENEDVYPYLVRKKGKVLVACVRHPPPVVIGHENGHVYRLGLLYQKLRQSKEYESKSMAEVLKKAHEIVGKDEFNARLKPYVQNTIIKLSKFIDTSGFHNTDMEVFVMDLNKSIPSLLWNRIDDDVRKYWTYNEWRDAIIQLFWGGDSFKFSQKVDLFTDQRKRDEFVNLVREVGKIVVDVCFVCDMWNEKNHDDLGNIMEKEIEYQDIIETGSGKRCFKDLIADGILLKELEQYKRGSVVVLKFEDVQGHIMSIPKFCDEYYFIMFLLYAFPLRLGHVPAHFLEKYDPQYFCFADEFYEAKLSAIIEVFKVLGANPNCMKDINTILWGKCRNMLVLIFTSLRWIFLFLFIIILFIH